MKKQYLLIIIAAVLISLVSACNNSKVYSTLIITGQNNHKWRASSPVLKTILDETGLFSCVIDSTPPKGGDMTKFNPDFSKYKLVVLDYNGDSWSEKTNAAFLKYVKNGGAVVVYHAANNAFPDWKEFNQIIGLGGWGNRNEKSGPYVYYKGNDIVRDDTSKGIGGTHGARSEYLVKTRNFEHPITKGLPANWLHGNDELYSMLRGPAENMEILATAFSATRPPRPLMVPGQAPAAGAPPAGPGRAAPAPAGTPATAGRNARATAGRNAPATAGRTGPATAAAATAPPPPPRNMRREGRDEPVLMTITYGKGRIFHTILGHADEGGGPAMQCAGFVVTLQRGAEWAVTGNVTQPIPWDFPSSAGVVIRPDYKEMSIEEAFANIGSYDIAKSTKYLTCIQSQIKKLAGNDEGLLNLEKMMNKVLINGEASVGSKRLLLRELSWMGSDYSVPAIKDLASNPELKNEADYALARLQKSN